MGAKSVQMLSVKIVVFRIELKAFFEIFRKLGIYLFWVLFINNLNYLNISTAWIIKPKGSKEKN